MSHKNDAVEATNKRLAAVPRYVTCISAHLAFLLAQKDGSLCLCHHTLDYLRVNDILLKDLLHTRKDEKQHELFVTGRFN